MWGLYSRSSFSHAACLSPGVMSVFTQGWMEMFFGDRAEDYIEMHLEDSAAFIPYGCMVDEFQHIVYENPDMTPGERHAAWLTQAPL